METSICNEITHWIVMNAPHPQTFRKIYLNTITSLANTAANIHLDVLKMSFVFVFRRRLLRQIHSLYSYVFRRRLRDVLKSSWSILIYSSWPYVFKTFFRRLQSVLQNSLQDIFTTSCQDFLKTSSKRLHDVLQKRLQDIFKTSSRHIQDVFNAFWRPLQDIFKKSFKDVFKTVLRRIIKLNCFRRSRICLNHTSEKFIVSVENLQVLA